MHRVHQSPLRLDINALHEDHLRKVDDSNERRVAPQIAVGPSLDQHGFPLEIGCFEANKADALTAVKQFQERHGIVDMVILADAGMLSGTNLRELDEAGLRFIVGSRVTNAPQDLWSHFRWHGTAAREVLRLDVSPTRVGSQGSPVVRRDL